MTTRRASCSDRYRTFLMHTLNLVRIRPAPSKKSGAVDREGMSSVLVCRRSCLGRLAITMPALRWRADCGSIWRRAQGHAARQPFDKRTEDASLRYGIPKLKRDELITPFDGFDVELRCAAVIARQDDPARFGCAIDDAPTLALVVVRLVDSEFLQGLIKCIEQPEHPQLSALPAQEPPTIAVTGFSFGLKNRSRIADRIAIPSIHIGWPLGLCRHGQGSSQQN